MSEFSARSALWDEPPRPRLVLTRADLARAALALLDELGFDGLTMRALAERLGVKAASLYNHIRDKGDVLALVADAIVADVPIPEASSRSWRERLDAICYSYRAVLLAHRDAARVLTVTPPVGPHRLRLMDEVLGIVRQSGLSDVDVADAAWVVNTFVTGFALDETQGVPAGSATEAAAYESREQVATWFHSLSADQFPHTVALAPSLLDPDMDRRFAFGLSALLDGLEARLGR